MVKKDLYRLLGLSRKARAKEIEKAYLKLARRLHPEVNPGDRQAAARFREVREAYLVLSNPRAKGLYDSTGETAPPPSGEAPAGAVRQGASESRGWESLARDIFHGEGLVEHESGGVRGEEVHHVLEILFHESMKGVEREVVYQREKPCRQCRGRRYPPGAKMGPCPDCGGTGLLSVQRGPYTAKRICPRCGGGGEVGSPLCPACGGRGSLPSSESVRVEIPAGTETGSRLTVPGGGQPGRRGGAPGDLVVTVRVQPHPDLERKGFNLYGEVPVSLAEAALGATVMVPTAERKVSLRIPAGTQSGQQFRLEGRGIPHPGGGRRGDLFITVNVRIPAAEDDRTRRIFQELAELYPENPRVRS